MFEKNEQKAAYRALNLLLDDDDNRSQLIPDELHHAQQARDFISGMIDGDIIASIWTTDDVKSLVDEDNEADGIAPVTDEEARQVLKNADDCHDAEIGINWDVLREHLDMVRREK